MIRFVFDSYFDSYLLDNVVDNALFLERMKDAAGVQNVVATDQPNPPKIVAHRLFRDPKDEKDDCYLFDIMQDGIKLTKTAAEIGSCHAMNDYRSRKRAIDFDKVPPRAKTKNNNKSTRSEKKSKTEKKEFAVKDRSEKRKREKFDTADGELNFVNPNSITLTREKRTRTASKKYEEG